MTQDDKARGLWVPALTPFAADLKPDARLFHAHCRWLLDNGANGLAVFGTTSEANSLSVTERMRLLDSLLESGIDMARVAEIGAAFCAEFAIVGNSKAGCGLVARAARA